MLFSILIANYNNSRFLETAIRSVYDQTYARWEIILTDDGSTDSFDEVVRPFQNDPRIRIFRNPVNEGCAYTKSFCAKMATGDLMAFLDPDDALTADALEVMTAAHIAHPEYSIIHSTHYVCDPKLQVERISQKPAPLPANTPYLIVSDGRIHHFASFKKALYDQTPGLMSVHRHQKAIDQELYYLLEETGPVLFINKPLYYYRIHNGSISNWGQEAAAMKSHFNIIEEACQRRIRFYSQNRLPDSLYWIRQYRTRYYKVRILNSARHGQWLRFIKSMMLYPFVGGLGNMLRYLSKVPRQGISLFRKSFIDSYQH